MSPLQCAQLNTKDQTKTHATRHRANQRAFHLLLYICFNKPQPPSPTKPNRHTRRHHLTRSDTCSLQMLASTVQQPNTTPTNTPTTPTGAASAKEAPPQPLTGPRGEESCDPSEPQQCAKTIPPNQPTRFHTHPPLEADKQY
jgi:hypothetical protein